ncbi:hypothetical protein MB84_27800 (plasmid) [Pandoraea oxalativorans]|uniref:Uncharacterized protein n=1 Tax=Pandoraea oxalativorans TaxID=573737 RepID=A0A0G3IHK1_9BURK|nr:hypothetical protein MB84_27800 [Pandoraea oxalativorans]
MNLFFCMGIGKFSRSILRHRFTQSFLLGAAALLRDGSLGRDLIARDGARWEGAQRVCWSRGGWFHGYNPLGWHGAEGRASSGREWPNAGRPSGRSAREGGADRGVPRGDSPAR